MSSSALINLTHKVELIGWLQQPLWRSVLVFGAIGIMPLFTGDVYYLGLTIEILIYAILALGSNLLLGYGAQASFAHHVFFAMGAYVSALIAIRFGVPPLLSIPIGIVIAGLAGIPIGYPALRLQGFFLAVATLAFAQIWTTFLIEFGPITGGPSGVPGVPRPIFFGFEFNSHESYFYLTLIITFFVFLFTQNLLDSRFGRALQAMGMSETGAAAFGISVSFMKLTVFIVSSCFMGLAGGLWAHFARFIAPESFAITQTVLIVAMSVVGGMRSVWGALLGAAFLILLPQAMRELGDWQFFSFGAVLMLTLIIMPKGFLPTLNYWFHNGELLLNLPSLDHFRKLGGRFRTVERLKIPIVNTEPGEADD